MKRPSVLVALDAAGICVDEVALLARQAEENQQIMAELERIKASYADRLRRNLEGVPREKATWGIG
jgi:hypothetical protein